MPLTARTTYFLIASLVTSASTLCAAQGLAQSSPSQEPDRRTTLKGPSVSTDTQNSLGTTDMSGRFTPVEGRPEIAAFMLVNKDPNDLAMARELDSQRMFDLTIFLVDEIDTVRAITDAINIGNATKAQLLLAGMRQQFEPELLRDPIASELEEMLDQEQTIEFRRILDTYWHQWAQSQHPDRKIKPGTAAAAKAEHTLSHKLFEQDIKLAYDTSLKRYRDTTDAIVTAIAPTTEQQAQIRDLIIEHIKETRLKATITQREDLMLEIYELLDDDRRVKFFRFMTNAAISRTG